MESKLEVRILLEKDLEMISKYARERVDLTSADQMEAEMHSWVARWRPESLEYYLPQGWSFGAFRDGKMVGFILGQPLIFFRGLTQTLWIEELIFSEASAGSLLLDTAYKWAKDKHLQCVYFESNVSRIQLVDGWKHAHHQDEAMIELRSSRF